ncbi:unnamed protein product [Clonostachys rhizophaga]|uniref:CHAT domain-containing protein n=1 Tax=Clonostachys rhizophaga TaxID=160324 RepID=A0A9N9VUL6_9HYPO|nr:unnamed protein product [Clonostachys rhizophaga]
MEGLEYIGANLRYTRSAYGALFYVSFPLGDEPRALALGQNTKRSDIDQEIDKLRHWLETASPDHAQRVSHLHTLGITLIEKFHLTTSFDAIDWAIEYLQEAIDLAPLESPTRPLQYLCLATAYQVRCERNMNTADIDSAIKLCREATYITGTTHHLRGLQMKILGDAYRVRLNCSGEVADVNESIRSYEEGLDLDLPINMIRIDLTHALGLGYQARYQVTATMLDMDTSLQLLQEACDATAGTYQIKNSRRRDLALGHQIKYLRNEDTLEINKAITLFQECVDHTPTGDPTLAAGYANLGTAYALKRRKVGSFKDLERSIELLQNAVKISKVEDPNGSSILGELGMAYQDKFFETKLLSDIDTAIETWQRAIDSSNTTKQQATQLQWKSRAVLERFHKTKSVTDIDQSILLMQRSLENTLPEDIPRAVRLFELGSRYKHKYRNTRAKEDLTTGTTHLRTVIQDPSIDVYAKILAGEDAMNFFALAEDWMQGYEVAASLIKLIPPLIPRFLETFDIQYVLRDIEGVACEAASMALYAGKEPSVALQFLEIGRDVIATSIEDLRGEVGILEEKYPDLANQFLTQRAALDIPATEDSVPDQRYKRGNVFENLVDKIRQLPGFKDFLREPSEDAPKPAASEHPIVVINVSRYRSDAIIISHDQILSMALADLSFEKIKAQSRHSPVVLSWLWDVAMKPILDFLGFTKIPISDKDWPRICWIPMGPLSGFPLHAAGYHNDGSSEAVIERVMSSYSSSVKAIINGRHDTKTTREVTRDRSLLVAMENTPGATRLPFATREVNMLHKLHISMSLDPIIAKNKTNILSQLPHCKIFHFAGHGFTDSQDPSRSHLLLEDNGKSDTLEVGKLLSLNIRQSQPFLAYLSACGTGQIKNNTFLDESIHLISGFRLAGFRHVIGTLWEVSDETCVDMAKDTYEGIRDGGMSDDSVCRGLHMASRALRKKCLSMLISRKERQARKDQVRDVGSTGEIQEERASERDVLPCEEDDSVSFHSILVSE